ncbi:MAG: M20/M25/M40 family metallo-hydrolase, partial [Phycisphaerae bacterium]
MIALLAEHQRAMAEADEAAFFAIFARGAADDKGQLFTHLLAVEAWLRTAGRLPIRVKFLIEGEEEISSPNLEAIVRSHRADLACDYTVISDTTKLDAHTPVITYGTRGIVYKEIVVTGPGRDLHSGAFGGTVANPANALASIIASLRDDFGRVRIPGFYADVRSLSDDEQAALKELRFDESAYLASTGAPSLQGEHGHDTLQRRWIRPTLDVNGIAAGAGGEGLLTIIPARASAKLSMRLVPDQNPQRISEAFDDAVCCMCPPGVRLEIIDHGQCKPYVAPIDLPAMSCVAGALEAGFGRRPVFVREGGTIPVISLFKKVLDVDTLMLGFALPDCGAHAPNEFLMLEDFRNGARTAVELLHRLDGPRAPLPVGDTETCDGSADRFTRAKRTGFAWTPHP